MNDVANYNRTVIPGIEGMLQADQEQGVLEKIAHIHVGEATWQALHQLGKITDNDFETTEDGGTIECTFNVKGEEMTFSVMFDTTADGFEPRDVEGKLVL